MRTTATAAAFAIAASLAAGQDFTKSSKSKSDGDDCAPFTNCSADTITRANLMTKLVVGYYGNDEGVIDSASIEEACDAADAATKDAFGQAVENAAVPIISNAICYVDFLMTLIKIEDRTFSDGGMQATFLDALCTFEEPVGDVPEDISCGVPFDEVCLPFFDPCKPLPPGPPGIKALALEDVNKPAADIVKSYLATSLGNLN